METETINKKIEQEKEQVLKENRRKFNYSKKYKKISKRTDNIFELKLTIATEEDIDKYIASPSIFEIKNGDLLDFKITKFSKYDLIRIIDELDTKAFYEREELLMRGFNHCENCRTILKNEDKCFFWCYMRIFLSCKKCFSSLRKSFPKPRISEEDLKIELDSMKNRRNNLKGHKYGRLRNKN